MLACVHICVRCVHSRSSPLSPPHLQLASARGLLAVIPRPCSLSGRACVRAMQASISELAVLPPQRMRECVVPFLFVDAKTRAWGQKCRKTKRRTRRVLRFGSVVKMYDYKERRGRAWFAHADKRNPAAIETNPPTPNKGRLHGCAVDSFVPKCQKGPPLRSFQKHERRRNDAA